jgi:membrane protein
MAESEHTDPLMRLAQRAADVAAVAQARYGERLEDEQQHLDQSAVRPAAAREPNVPSPDHARAAAPPATEGSEQHQESREKVGDPEAPPAPAGPTSVPEPCRDHVLPHGAWPTLKELFRRFGQDQCGTYAASLAFFGILSLVPIALVAVVALTYLFHSPQQAVAHLQKLIANMLPGGAAQSEIRHLLVDRANVGASVTTLMQTRGIAGIIGVLSLIWAAMQIFISAAPAMNAAYEVQESRGWIKLRLMALGLFLGAGVLFLLSLLPSTGPAFVSRLHIPWLNLPQSVPWYIDTLFWLIALAINVTMFALIYRFLPNAITTWREAFVGGVVAGVLWEIAKRGFAFYLAHFANYNKVYGGLGALVILILWIYYTSMILLLGAEVASLYQDFQQAATSGTREAATDRRAPTASRDRARA